MNRMDLFKRMFLLVVVFGLAFASLNFVSGVQGATGYTLGTSSSADFTTTSSVAIAAEAGNVTNLDISGTSVTTHWAGFYGNISGNVTLEDSAGYVFYDWTGLGIPSGQVLASNSSAVDWTGIGCADAGEITAIETALGITATDVDTIAATYPVTTHPGFTLAGVSISSCDSTNAYSNSTQDSNLYFQILLTDTTGNPVYTTLINDSAMGFNTLSYDFQLLVGESDAAGTSQLYFYIELD